MKTKEQIEERIQSLKNTIPSSTGWKINFEAQVRALEWTLIDYVKHDMHVKKLLQLKNEEDTRYPHISRIEQQCFDKPSKGTS